MRRHLIALTLPLLLAACGGNQPASEAPAASTPATQAPATSAAPSPFAAADKDLRANVEAINDKRALEKLAAIGQLVSGTVRYEIEWPGLTKEEQDYVIETVRREVFPLCETNAPARETA